jgi:hypothetical protein
VIDLRRRVVTRVQAGSGRRSSAGVPRRNGRGEPPSFQAIVGIEARAAPRRDRAGGHDTPSGRFGGALRSGRPAPVTKVPEPALVARTPSAINWS